MAACTLETTALTNENLSKVWNRGVEGKWAYLALNRQVTKPSCPPTTARMRPYHKAHE